VHEWREHVTRPIEDEQERSRSVWNQTVLREAERRKEWEGGKRGKEEGGEIEMSWEKVEETRRNRENGEIGRERWDLRVDMSKKKRTMNMGQRRLRTGRPNSKEQGMKERGSESLLVQLLKTNRHPQHEENNTEFISTKM
jgi:hypothetical protein